ncbi:CRP-like cAMP-binding protein [Clostridium acetobutylicum]|uniref:Predicted cAMP-binding domain, regulatory protein, diverged n=1 Tax=Clostridium acetobutylicum (strain ATCC 824 / DSM 792 / JCM 1419 / IAM 19013 / LMG 5710 / NBRC 13948 / NRRL B-527 / VKM B-1787 / 2291 / W) TaxID=272562 RepID=Q97DY4_CLOAB|nr:MULTISPECIES: Crp/Fnr family transcriptional regulator [Clostridium]AAK81268.1 Predicted cAMP-binding domain, regulatory protein, diverged [Clostridium acetobutylicum ATCC 824]ADZ22376.1 cAMP-binding domain, regulatory protein, diverged [Clostridium acetobutylicum EA 2018]AEI32778.1 cAMP-binding domain-containing protein [Clostridium acetobutylicum DSM 1731]AWV81064.1 Crp/Fnr family transcriptional regulator [Clostridium acetobutylicum]MBC2395579.1 Crp/Fnr family transcriptional regulator [
MSNNTYDNLWWNILKSNSISLDEKNLSLLKDVFSTRLLKKNSLFLKQGDNSIKVAFIVKGVFRSYYIDRLGNDITKHFHTEGETLFSYAAYLSQKESMYSIQALEDSEILVAKISDFEKIVEGNYNLLLCYKKMIDRVLVKKEEHASSFKLLSSIERYKQFVSEKLGLENRIKQCYLASYLGITPVSLSRIRRKLNINK